jgi:putative ABC transport system permease protein
MKGVDRGTRWFRRLLRLLPADFQADYARDMERTFRAQRREAGERGRLGALALWWETLRDVLRTAPREHLGQIRQDVRYAIRLMARRPTFTAVTALVFAIGIGGTTAVFSVLDAALLRPVPFEDPARLVAVREQTPQDTQPWELSYPSYLELRRDARSFEQLGAYQRNGVVIGGPEPTPTEAALASANLLETLRVKPIAGRGFRTGEDAPGGAAVALIRDDLARARFGSAEQAVGSVLTIDDRPTTVVGVLPARFRFPISEVALWLPIGQLGGEPFMRNRSVHFALVVGRLAPGVPIDSARAEVVAWMDALQAREPDADPRHRMTLVSLAEQVSGGARPAVTVLTCAVLLLLGVTCSSVGLLLLTRSAGRGDEILIRLSLGASRGRLARQLLTESIAVAALGASLGIAAAYSLLAFLVHGLQDALPPFVEPSINIAALAAAAVCTVIAAVMAGVVPAAKTLSFARTSASQPPRARQHLVTVQVAISCVLVVAAALLARSLDRLLRVDPGFRADHLLVLRVTAPNALYTKPRAMTQFYQAASARLRRLPGVTDIAVLNRPPIQPGSQADLTIEGHQRRTAPIVTYRRVLPGSFRALGIPLVEGRDFTERDGITEAVTIVSTSLARRFWPPGQAIGQRIKVGPVDQEPWLRIVGVVGDVRNASLEIAVDLATYEPHTQRPWNGMFMMVRTAAEPSAMTEVVRRALREVEPQVLVSSVSTMEDRIAESVASRRFHAMVVGAFAATTLVLVALAVYGVLAYWVASHTREIGIRAAVGASSSALVRAVVLEGLRPTFIGLAVGLLGAWTAASAGRTLLFEVEPHEPWTYTATAALFLSVALASSCIPARRAIRVDPSTALRAE